MSRPFARQHLPMISFLLSLAILGASASAIAQAPKTEPEKEVKLLDFGLRHNLTSEGKIDPKAFHETKAWRQSDFSGQGQVRVEAGTAFLDEGNDMTGVTWTGPLVRMNYEITLQAQRVDGEDFFCGLTFPYDEDPCSLIVGGWGGTVVGISCLDYNDAYNNETARFMTFEKGRWYDIRLRVTPEKIEAWIDGKQMVDVDTPGRAISIRWEVEPSVPFGFSSWRTAAAIRNVRLEAFQGPEHRVDKPDTL